MLDQGALARLPSPREHHREPAERFFDFWSQQAGDERVRKSIQVVNDHHSASE
jgi:hypothetical protein